MRSRTNPNEGAAKIEEQGTRVPTPSTSYRRRAWLEFQRALDPLAPLKQLPPPRG